MTLSEVKDPDGGGLLALITERSVCVSCLWEVGARGWDYFTTLLPWWPGGLCPLEQEGRRGRSALKETRPTGWDKKEKEGWFGPQGKDRKALTTTEDSVLVQLKAAPLG